MNGLQQRKRQQRRLHSRRRRTFERGCVQAEAAAEAALRKNEAHMGGMGGLGGAVKQPGRVKGKGRGSRRRTFERGQVEAAAAEATLRQGEANMGLLGLHVQNEHMGRERTEGKATHLVSRFCATR